MFSSPGLKPGATKIPPLWGFVSTIIYEEHIFSINSILLSVRADSISAHPPTLDQRPTISPFPHGAN